MTSTATSTGSGVTHSGPSTGISDDRDYNVQSSIAFWPAPVQNEEQLKALRIIFIDGMKHGPPRNIPGIRDPHDPSIKDDNSPTVLVFRKTCAMRRKWRCVSWEPFEDSNPETWDKFTKEISSNVEKKWPTSLSGKATSKWPKCLRGKATSNCPPCSAYDRNWFQRASVILTELSYDEHGFPKQVHRNGPQHNDSIPAIPKESPKAINASPVQPQPAWGNKIFGRSWYVGLSSREILETVLMGQQACVS